nr:HAD-IC family P-type ATPase [Butyricicoccus sp. OF13-6]
MHKWVYTAMTFLVISCPCALVLSVPLTYFSGIGAGSRRGILFKGGASLEALNNVKTIVMDKTGTITKGNFVVQKVVPAQGVPLDENELLWLAAACEGASTHPIAKSIINSYEERKTSAAKAGDFSLVAVGATVENIREQAGEGVFAELEGKTILCGNVKLMERNHIDLSGYHGTPGSTEVLLAMDGHFLGHVDIADTIKADANSAISRMKAQGLTTAMLTGDGQASADAVAQEVGIDEVRARLLPQDKLSALTDIREKRGAVMFVGDGINDAPVLAGADVGAAMGSGADAAIEAADVVFMTRPDLYPDLDQDRPQGEYRLQGEHRVCTRGQDSRYDPRSVRYRIHVAGRIRRYRRGYAVRAQFDPHAVYEDRIMHTLCTFYIERLPSDWNGSLLYTISSVLIRRVFA